MNYQIQIQIINGKASVVVRNENEGIDYTLTYHGSHFHYGLGKPVLEVKATPVTKIYYYTWEEIEFENHALETMYKGWNVSEQGKRGCTSIPDLPIKTISGKVVYVEGQASIIAEFLNGL